MPGNSNTVSVPLSASRRDSGGTPQRSGSRTNPSADNAPQLRDEWTRVKPSDDGQRLEVRPDKDFRPNDSYSISVELQNTIKEANDALFLNQHDEARASEIQLQIQRLQKIFGLIEQNRGNAIAFVFKLIEFFAQIFGLQTIR